ncbi:putative membrane protein [Algoriphagus sp. 4150]|nr:putative membrane protein [Algoriphagus sp. 4150]
MQMAEKQSAHRMAMGRKALSSHVNQGYIGQVFGLIIGLSTIAAGVYLGLNDQPTLGAVIAGVGITGLVTAFIKGRDIEREEMDAKPKKSK